MTIGDSSEQVDLTSGQRPELTGGQPLDRDRADGDPGQGHHLVTQFGQHPTDLAILPFGEDEFEDGRLASLTDHLDPLGPDFSLGQPDPVGQLAQDFTLGRAGDDDSIEFLDTKFRVGELVGEFAVVRQKQKPDTHLVEPADGVDALGDLGQEIENAGATGWVVVGGDVALGLVDREIDGTLDLDLLAVE